MISLDEAKVLNILFNGDWSFKNSFEMRIHTCYSLVFNKTSDVFFFQKLRPGLLSHGHNSINSQQISMALQGILSIGSEKLYHKYIFDWLRDDRLMTLESLPCLLFQCVLY